MQQRIVVIGAGMVGLATAWHLQRRGAEVTVIDRTGVAAGSSWGNAGWLTPGLAMPLADPSIWAYAPKALLDPDAPLHVPMRMDPNLFGFLLRFAGHGTQRAWNRAMAALTTLDRIALDEFDALAAAGVASPTHEGPFTVAFEHPAQAVPLLRELKHVEHHGQRVPISRVRDRRRMAPYLSDRITEILRLDGQRFIEPGPYVQSLADAVVREGGTIRSGVDAVGITSGRDVRVEVVGGDDLIADRVVIATGAWLPKLARGVGVRTIVRGGRGYSFSVATPTPITTPVYFPARRVACTPYQGRLRIAGTMEFRHPDEPFQNRRVRAIVNSVRDLFVDLDLDDRRDEWVGARPITPDGLPLIGVTRDPNVFVAGGHGMWGVFLGPLTGKLLAEQIITGTQPELLAPFSPLR